MTVSEKLNTLPKNSDGWLRCYSVKGIVGQYGLTLQWICGAGNQEQRFIENDKISITHVLPKGGVRLGIADSVIDPNLFKGLEIKRFTS